MAKKKRLTVKQLIATIERDFSPSDRRELICQLLRNLPQREFGLFAWEMYGHEFVPRFHCASLDVVDKWQNDSVLLCALQGQTLKARYANVGRKKSDREKGDRMLLFVCGQRNRGRSEGEI